MSPSEQNDFDFPPANLGVGEDFTLDFDQFLHDSTVSTVEEDEFIEELLKLLDEHLDELGLEPMSPAVSP